jgi:hypothetical protein
MKIGIFRNRGWAVGLALLPLVARGLAEDQNQKPPAITPPAALSEQGQTNLNASKVVEPSAVEATNLVDLVEAPVTPMAQEKTLPPSIHPARPLAEIIKLANSGVEESVMMAFVTNSTSTFNLNAEEIIYLKDIGVPDVVVTAMILRDQTLRSESITTLAAAAPPPAEMPVAPNASEVAPQPDATAAAYPPEQAPPPTEVAADSSFYDALSPYGNWVNVAGYGPCWQPTVVVVNPGWQPYYNCGRWIYTDCGWYWVSDYSWGWAPFHYGRWFCHHRLGWCWAPDTVWGPSWVSWRYTDGYCGWAPLPPGTSFAFGVGLTFRGHHVDHSEDFGLKAGHFRFVAWNHFRERDYQHYRVPPQQRDQLFKHSVVATSFSGDSQGIVNDGLPPQKVAAATGTQVRRVAVREAAGTARAGGGAEHFDPNGRTVTVYRPNFGQTAAVGSVGNSLATPNSKSPAIPRSTVTAVPGRSPGNLDEPVAGPTRTSPYQPVGRPAQNSPLVLRGPQTSAVQETPPASSLIVIGRKDPNGSQSIYRSTVPAATTRPSLPSTATTSPGQRGWTDSPSSSPTPWAENEFARETPNQTWNQSPAVNLGNRPPAYVPRNGNATYGYERSATTYRQPAPAYQPSARSAPAEVPRYAPSPAANNNNNVQRSYSAPAPSAPSRSQPADSRPAPAPSAPAQSGSRNQR